MNKQIIELLKELESAEEQRYTADDSYLTRIKKIDKSTIIAATQIDLVRYSGVGYYLTEKGYERLDTKKSLEYLEKIHRSVNSEKIGLIFDSNIFNKIMDGELSKQEIELGRYKGFEYFVSHIQVDELSRTSEEDKRARLTMALATLKATPISTESFVLGTSRLGVAKISDGIQLEKLRTPENHTNDALIGEIAIKQKLILVANDKRLRNRVKDNGGKAVTFEEFKEMIK